MDEQTRKAGSGTAGRLFCFGLGYSALALARRLLAEGWTVAGTTRSRAKADRLAGEGIEVFLFDRDRPLEDPAGTASVMTLCRNGRRNDRRQPVCVVARNRLMMHPLIQMARVLRSILSRS